MPTHYKVIGACVTNVPATTANGTQLMTLYTGQLLPADRIKHLLSVKLIEEVGGANSPAEESSSPPPGGDQGGGKAVNARSSKAELVEFGVAQGGDRAELDALTHKDLQARFLKSGAQQ